MINLRIVSGQQDRNALRVGENAAMVERLRIIGAIRVWGILAHISGLSVLAPPTRAANAELRPFTVKDSIEISYFVNPDFWSVNQNRRVAPIASPDQRWFLVTTQRGVLASNRLESTIWVFSQEAISGLVSNKSGVSPRPKAVATFQATTNNPVITDVRWLADSRRIAFIASDQGEYPALYRRCDQWKSETHHQRQSIVTAYDICGDMIAYATLDDPMSPEPQPDLVPVTGQSIWELLWRDRPLGDRDDSLLLNVPTSCTSCEKGKTCMCISLWKGGPSISTTLCWHYPLTRTRSLQ